MKLRNIFGTILLIVLIDQIIKIWIKTNFPTGEVMRVFDLDWFRLHFIENPGMAWGINFGGEFGKIFLTLFRLVAVVFGTWYIFHIRHRNFHKGLFICIALIYAGALGNLIDSLFYGLIFDKGLVYNPIIHDYQNYSGIAAFSTNGYASFLHGSVVDMFYFPIVRGQYPDWVPILGGEWFEFFSPIFNVADASISCGVILLLIFQKKFLVHQNEEEEIIPQAENNIENKPVEISAI